MQSTFNKAILQIDQENALDPNLTVVGGKEFPKELLYSQRMTEILFSIYPNPSDELQIAVRAQHIKRWAISRKNYPMDRVGYFQWRNDLKDMHADTVSKILQDLGYQAPFIERVAFLIKKKNLKKDTETQMLEDTACLVFLQYYMKDFISKHDDDKVIDIIKKTWRKMSETGHDSALKLSYSDRGMTLIKKALDIND